MIIIKVLVAAITIFILIRTLIELSEDLLDEHHRYKLKH